MTLSEFEQISWSKTTQWAEFTLVDKEQEKNQKFDNFVTIALASHFCFGTKVYRWGGGRGQPQTERSEFVEPAILQEKWAYSNHYDTPSSRTSITVRNGKYIYTTYTDDREREIDMDDAKDGFRWIHNSLLDGWLHLKFWMQYFRDDEVELIIFAIKDLRPHPYGSPRSLCLYLMWTTCICTL